LILMTISLTLFCMASLKVKGWRVPGRATRALMMPGAPLP